MLDAFFAPRSIAVVGASRDEAKVGYAVFANLLAGGFAGTVFPINPSAEPILGRPAYPSLTALPEVVDLAVVVVPAQATIPVIEECGARGVPAAVVISAGFRETGPAGADLERRMLEAARAGGVRILGPNCLGFIATASGVNASFAPLMPAPGTISFLSQSGALGTAVLDWAAGEGIGLAHFVSLGNKADISEVDLIRAWGDEPATGVVVAYLEGIADGEGFVLAAQELGRRAPLIALMAGSSEAGARAVSSHTGTLAGSKAAYTAAFRKAGVIEAATVQELFDFAEGFSRQPLPAGPGVAILTNAGGPAILATDACERVGVRLARLGADTVEALRGVLPAAAALYNPVDVLGDADASRYETAARILVRDPAVNSLLVVLTPQAMTQAEDTARAVAAVASDAGVTTLAVFMGDRSVAAAVRALKDAGIAAYSFPEQAVATLGAMERHAGQRMRAPDPPMGVPADYHVVRAALDHARDAGRTFITEESAGRIARAYGLAVPGSGLARDRTEAHVLAERIGYPVVLKIASPDILHKTDIGGIALDIVDTAALDVAYERMMSSVRHRMPDAHVWGVTVQRQLPPGHEVIVGVHRDPSFGPVLMFGLGGVYVEVLKDVAFRLCPVTPTEARSMIEEIRGYGVLRGARGAAPADIDSIVDAICRVSALAIDFPEVTELDINPLIVGRRGDGAFAADIRIGIGG